MHLNKVATLFIFQYHHETEDGLIWSLVLTFFVLLNWAGKSDIKYLL